MVKREGGFQDSEKQNSSFLAQVDKLQKAFLKRPGCPQLSTRATSMAHCGERGVGAWGGVYTDMCSSRRHVSLASREPSPGGPGVFSRIPVHISIEAREG